MEQNIGRGQSPVLSDIEPQSSTIDLMFHKFLLILLCFSAFLSASAQRPLTVSDTFHIEGKGLIHKLYYHDLRVRTTIDLKPIMWNLEDEMVRKQFRKSMFMEIGSYPLVFGGTVLIAAPVFLNVSGGPYEPGFFWAGMALLGVSFGLDLAKEKNVLLMIRRYNYVVRHRVDVSWKASPAGLGMELRF